jgi:hypothetical protein
MGTDLFLCASCASLWLSCWQNYLMQNDFFFVAIFLNYRTRGTTQNKIIPYSGRLFSATFGVFCGSPLLCWAAWRLCERPFLFLLRGRVGLIDKLVD